MASKTVENKITTTKKPPTDDLQNKSVSTTKVKNNQNENTLNNSTAASTQKQPNNEGILNSNAASSQSQSQQPSILNNIKNATNLPLSKLKSDKQSLYKKLKAKKINPNRYQIPNHPHSPTNRRKMNQSRPEKVDVIRKPLCLLPFDNEKVLQNLIRTQIEYLFSDYHLTNDTYLLARMQDNTQHWLSIDEICHNQKVRCLTNKKERILNALRESIYLELSSDELKVRRPDFKLPKLKPNRDLRRTVFLYGIPKNKNEQDIIKLLSSYGHIKRIHFQSTDDDHNGDDDDKIDRSIDNDDEAPNKCVSLLIMKKKFLFPSRYNQQSDNDSDQQHGSYHSNSDTDSMKKKELKYDYYSHPIRNPNGDHTDFSHLITCFVVFESQSQATKCVKARVRASDGMRCIHKYDYNKVAKKLRTAQMKGENLSFSPPPNSNYSRSPSVQSQILPNTSMNSSRSHDNGHNNSSRPYNSFRRDRYQRNNDRNNSYSSFDRRANSLSSGIHSSRRNQNNSSNNNQSGGYYSQRRPGYYGSRRNNDNKQQYYGYSKTPTVGSMTRGQSSSHHNSSTSAANTPQQSYNVSGSRRRNNHNQYQNNNQSDRRYTKKESSPSRGTISRRMQPPSPHRSVGNDSNSSDHNNTHKRVIYTMKKKNDENRSVGNAQSTSNISVKSNNSAASATLTGSKNEVKIRTVTPTRTRNRTTTNMNMKTNGSINVNDSSNTVLSRPPPPPSSATATNRANPPPPAKSTQNVLPNHANVPQLTSLQKSQSQNVISSNKKQPNIRSPPQLHNPIHMPSRQEAAQLAAAGYLDTAYLLPYDDTIGVIDDAAINGLYEPFFDMYIGAGTAAQTTTHSTLTGHNPHRTHLQSHSTVPALRGSTGSSSASNLSSATSSLHHHYYTHPHQAQQQHATTTAHPTHPTQTYAQYPYATPHHHTTSTHSAHPTQTYSSQTAHAHSYHPAGSNGPRSAPYGPIATPVQGFHGQWQLDKIDKKQFAAQLAKTQQQPININVALTKRVQPQQLQLQQTQSVPPGSNNSGGGGNVNGKKPVTALSVLSSGQ